MKKKSLTNKAQKLRELTRSNIRDMRFAADVLPADLLKVLPKRKVGERGKQKMPTKVLVTLRCGKVFQSDRKGVAASDG